MAENGHWSEGKDELFSEDLFNIVIQDDVLLRLLTFPDALADIVETALTGISAFERGEGSGNKVAIERLRS